MRSFSWAWTPFLAIAIAAVANASMIVRATAAHPDPTPGLRSGSGGSDAGVAARVAFARTGARLGWEAVDGGVRLRVSGEDLRDLSVACERPADAAMDRHAGWLRAAEPLDIPLPAAGRWTLRLTGFDAHGRPIEHLEEILLP